MTSPNPPSQSSSELLAKGLAWVGLCMIALFLISITGNFLPTQLINPDWQLALASALVDNGAYALLGTLLVLLANGIDPADEKLARRQTLMRSLACWACCGYLLLLPLQGLILTLGLSQASNQLIRQVRSSRESLQGLRSAITASTSLQDLNGRLRRLQAPPLSAEAASIPLADLKTSLLARLNNDDNALQQSLRQPLLQRLLAPMQKSLRNGVSALVLALGFAAVATPRGSSRTLLQSWAGAFQGMGQGFSGLGKGWQERRLLWQQRAEQARRAAQIRRAKKQQDPALPPRWPWSVPARRPPTAMGRRWWWPLPTTRMNPSGAPPRRGRKRKDPTP